jgi:PAS domain S-box-containing protein
VRRDLAASALADLLFDEPGVGRCLVAPDGTVLRSNAEWLRSTGFSLDDVLGADIIELFPETRGTAPAMHARARAGHRVEVPRYARRVHGRETWWEGSIAPVPMDGGMGLLIATSEVTEQMAGDAAGLQLFLDSVKDYAIFMLDPEGRVTSWNSGAERIKGYRADEIIGDHVSRFYAPEDVARGKPDAELNAAAAAGRFEDEGWRVRKDGARFWANVVISRVADPCGRLLGFAKVTRDLTGRKREEQLVAEKERLAVTLRSIGDAVIATDETARVTVFNGVAEELTGWKAEEAAGRSLHEIFNIINEHTRQPVVSPVDRVLREGTVVGLANHTVLIARDGREVPIDDSGAPIHRPDGSIAGVVLVFRDVSVRRKVDRELAGRAEQLSLALEAADLGAWDYHFKTDNVFWDERCRSMWGVPQGDQIDYADAIERIHPEDRVAVDEAVEQALAGAHDGAYHRAFRVVWPDGSLHWVASHGRVYFEGEGPGRRAVRFIGVNRDISREMQVEQSLREREERLAVTLRSIGDAVIATDGAGRVTILNAVAEELTGWNAPEAIGRPFHEVFNIVNEDTRQPAVSPVERVLREGVVVGLANHTALVARDGTARPIADSAAPIRDSSGLTSGVVLVFRDQTQERRAEEALRQSEQRLRALADSMPQLAWTAQADGYITWYNQRWYEYTGTTPEQMEGWGWQSVHAPATLPDVLHRWRESIATGTAFEMEFPLRGADGKFRRFLTRVFPLKDSRGAVTQWFGTNTDVTELVEAQEALLESDRRKNEFIGVLSHELRNPLAPIRSSLYLLDRAPPGSERAARAREIIHRQTGHLSRLVDDLLDVTRISRGKIELQRSRIDAREVVRRACDDHRTLFHDRGLELRVEISDPVWIEADETRIAQVVGNLLQNAAKFSREGGTVIVSVGTAADQAEVRVRDDGIGITGDLMPRLFQPFVQAEGGLARTKGGLGLGLALVKGLVELHGGSVRAFSGGAGRGSELVVSLPLSPAPEQSAPAPLPAAATRGMEILVIEDNVDAARSIAEVLEMEGHRVHVATDGLSGIAKARELRPEVVMCDIGLPDIDGYEIARTLRADGLRSTRLIALSGYAQHEDRQRAKEAGFDAHLPKPPPLDELNALLAKVP